jgi:2-succinyl-5-enolpyruvyl-6-hydroxy-3-cyclohexene-1-carboxylate synthase
LNLQFIEPLSSTEPDAAEILEEILEVQEHTLDKEQAFETCNLDLTEPTVVVAGANSHANRYEIAELGLPVFAEPTSGVRDLESSIINYRALLREGSELVNQIKQIIVYGKPTLSRPVIALLQRTDVKVFVRESQMGPFAIGNQIEQVQGIIEGTADASWLSSWLEASVALNLSESSELDRKAIIEKTWAASPSDDSILVLGASQLIREADFYAPRTSVRAWANRGLSGIDGTIATATGIAIQEPDKTVRALMGDLTFLHDVGSLVIDQEDGYLNLQLIVVNDNGGKIFSNLEVAQSVPTTTFKRIFQTPQNVDISKLAEGYGWQYLNPKNLNDYVLSLAIPGRVIIEVNLD